MESRTVLIAFGIIAAIIAAIILIYFTVPARKVKSEEQTPEELAAAMAQVRLMVPGISDKDIMRFLQPQNRNDCAFQADLMHTVQPLTGEERAFVIGTCMKGL